MDIMKIAALGILGVLAALELKSHKPVYGILLITGIVLFMITFSLGKITEVFAGLEDMFNLAGEGHYFALILKAVGITYLSELSSGICQDAGFGTIASQIRIFAKIYILFLGMPIIVAFLETLQNMSL
ncbi:MAG: stage III sporulation protein AD [Lachnospiraceae bacterium]|nr:stage III sporulation protein AD [Lachnospiraceae bacterium]